MKRRIFYVIIEPRIFCIESRTFGGVYPVMCQCTLPSAHQRFIDFWFARHYDRRNGGRVKPNILTHTPEYYFHRYSVRFLFGQYRRKKSLCFRE